jgi:hypothetical protein
MEDTSPPTPDMVALQSRLNELEAKLIEQDHRWVSVAMNLYQAFTALPKGDMRRAAALRAVLWRVFSPATVAGAGIGLISILGLVVALQANHLLALQNKRIDQQTLLLEAQRRSGLVTEFTAVVEQVQKEREAKLTAQTRERRKSKGNKAGEGPDAKLVLASPTVGRVVALSRSYRPYLYLEIDGDADASLVVTPTAATKTKASTAGGEGWLDWINRWLGLDLDDDGERPNMTRTALSPERGQLLITLTNGQVDLEPLTQQSVDFSRADLRKAVLEGARMPFVNLTRAAMGSADLLNADLTRAFLAGADLSRACLRNVNFSGAIMHGVNLSGAALDGAIIVNPEQLERANLSNTQLEKLFVSGKEWLDVLAHVSPPLNGFVRADWQLEPIDRPSTIKMLEAKVGKGATTGWYQIKAINAITLKRYQGHSICS